MNKEKKDLKIMLDELPQETSILEVMDPSMLQGQTMDNPFIQEIGIWGSFYSQKFLEKEDRDEIKNLGRRAAKLFLLSIFTGGIINRVITKARFKKYYFLNLRFFITLP